MALFNKLKNAGIWQTTEVVALVASQFLYMAVMARVLSKEDFGLMAIVNSLSFFGYIFAESGVGVALVQKKNITNKHITAALQGSILFGLILYLIFYFFSPQIASFFDQPELTNLIRVIAVNFIVLSVSAVSLGILQKQFKFKEKSIVTTVSVVIAYTVGIIFGLKDFGVWSLVIANMLLALLKTIGFFYFARLEIVKGVFYREYKELFSYGFGILLLRVNNFIGTNGINLVLAKIFSPALLGIFERAFQIKTLPSSYLGNILDTIMFPAMSEIQDEKEKLFKVYQHSLGLVNTILIPLAFYLIFFSAEIVSILLGPGWEDAILPLQIMFIVLPFSSSGRMADSVLRAKGLVYQNAFRKFLYVIVLLITSGFGAYYYGLEGAAFGVTFSFLFNYITMLFLVRKVFNESIVNIFLSPVLSGVKLTSIIAIVLISITSLFNYWGSSNVLFFFIVTVLLGIVIVVLVFKKPSFFGKYLSEILIKIRNNN